MSRPFAEAVERGLAGMTAVSTGLCPGCPQCASENGFDNQAEFDQLCQEGRIANEGGFSHGMCGICRTTLGGNRYTWHWIDPDDKARAIVHENDACEDCVVYLANGDLPDHWRP